MASPMALTRSLTLLLIFAIGVPTGASEDGANFYVTKCYPAPTLTVDGSSEFRGALPSAAAPTGFASLQTAGRTASDRANMVRGLCLGDSAPSPDIVSANYSASADDEFGAVFFSGDAVPSPDIVSVQRLVSLAQSLARRDGSVATAYATIPASKGDANTGDRTVHVVAQRARDRGAADCARCLRGASLAEARSWEAGGGAQGRVARVLSSNCYLLFEILPPELTPRETIRKVFAVLLHAVVECVLIGIVVLAPFCALFEVYDWIRSAVLYALSKARNNRNAAAAAAPAAEAMPGIRTTK